MPEVQTAPVSVPFSTSYTSNNPSSRLNTSVTAPFAPLDTFARRHLGVQPEEVETMLKTLGYASLEKLVDAVVPPAIRLRRPLDLPAPKGEREALETLREIMSHNKVLRSFIGQG